MDVWAQAAGWPPTDDRSVGAPRGPRWAREPSRVVDLPEVRATERPRRSSTSRGTPADREFAAFLDDELDNLRRYAQLLTGNPEDAHDLLADTLIKAQLSWPRISAAEVPVAYVRRMLTNAHISEHRRWGRRMITSVDPADLPERRVESVAPTTDLDELAGLLGQLPSRQRAAVVLRYFLHLSDSEISIEMGCSSVSVRSLVSRGLAGLRVRIQHSEGDL
jgi:RNA polymerase sigma-70 factor (sigma-E family)